MSRFEPSANNDNSTEPLRGVTVVSIAEQYPGPYATLLLADLGADVILVERPSGGDPSRRFPQFHEALNRNKRSVAIDLKDDRGRLAFLELARNADVLLEGFSPGVVERLGVAYADVQHVNPGIVYVSISGFGRWGPLRDRAAHDLSYQAMAGLLEERRRDGEPGQAPPVAIGDLTAGMFAAIAALAGIASRRDGGGGGQFDVSMLDSLMSLMTIQLFARANGFASAGIPPREPGYGVFKTADGGLMSLSVSYEDWFWSDLCGALGMDDVASMQSSVRQERFEELTDRLTEAIGRRNQADLQDILGTTRVPFGTVRTIDEIVGDADATDHGILVDVPATPAKPSRRHAVQPIRAAGRKSVIRRHAPALGEHTTEVLEEVGIPADDVIAMLRRQAAHQSGEVG